ncbi:MAG: alkaline phosphatase family protein [Alphaproteobacteria bacterium]
MRIAKRTFAALSLGALALLGAVACQQKAAAPARPHNVVIFVADGLRYGSVNATDAPALNAVKTEGVDFANSHSLFPTVTTVNASAIATGHYIGDTGDFGNSLYVGEPLKASYFNRLASLEDDDVLREMNDRFGGNYLNETSLIAAARAKGYSTAVIGKTGPAGIQDLTATKGDQGLVIDELTGLPDGTVPGGIKLSPDLAKVITDAKLPPNAPPRARPAMATVDWLTKVATDVLIPKFKSEDKPFVMLFWCPDPDNTQHGQNDGNGALVPGVNGPTSKAAVANASQALGRLRDALKAQGLDATTDIFVTADHGFSVVSREGKTSYSLTQKYRDWPKGVLPTGFVAIDLAHALNMKLWQTNGLAVAMDDGIPPKSGSAMLGPDIEHPHVIIASNGGAELIYLTDPSDAKTLAPKIVETLTQQDYVGGIFIDEDTYGKQPGALGMADVRLIGSAKTPRPSIVISFRSYDTGGKCDLPEMCSAIVTDSNYQQGQGTHGSLGRGETRNFMAAIGPDFKSKFVNSAPISNADITPTLAQILGLDLGGNGKLKGRVITEALKDGKDVTATAETKKAAPAANGFATTLNLQRVDDAEYFDAAGSEGRAIGLKP